MAPVSELLIGPPKLSGAKIVSLKGVEGIWYSKVFPDSSFLNLLPQLTGIILQTNKLIPKEIPSHNPIESSALCAFATWTTRRATIIVVTCVRSLECQQRLVPCSDFHERGLLHKVLNQWLAGPYSCHDIPDNRYLDGCRITSGEMNKKYSKSR